MLKGGNRSERQTLGDVGARVPERPPTSERAVWGGSGADENTVPKLPTRRK